MALSRSIRKCNLPGEKQIRIALKNGGTAHVSEGITSEQVDALNKLADLAMEKIREEKKAAFLEKAHKDQEYQKLHEELIKKHFEKYWGGLHMASVKYFLESGSVSGSMFLMLIEYAEEFASIKAKAETEMVVKIVHQYYLAAEKLGADMELLSLFGSYKDTLEDNEILELLEEYNERPQ